MFVKNEDLNIMIKIENLIGINEKKIFGENKDNIIKVDTYEITYNDFINYMNLIQRIIQNQKKLSNRNNAYNKANKEYHKIINCISWARKSGNQERLDYWNKQLDNYKKRRGKDGTRNQQAN